MVDLDKHFTGKLFWMRIVHWNQEGISHNTWTLHQMISKLLYPSSVLPKIKCLGQISYIIPVHRLCYIDDLEGPWGLTIKYLPQDHWISLCLTRYFTHFKICVNMQTHRRIGRPTCLPAFPTSGVMSLRGYVTQCWAAVWVRVRHRNAWGICGDIDAKKKCLRVGIEN